MSDATVKPNEYYLTSLEAHELFAQFFVKTVQNSYSDDTYYEVPNTQGWRSLAARLPHTNYGWKAYIPEESYKPEDKLLNRTESGEKTFTVEYSYNIGD